jgi:hypothetical protein
MERLKFWIKKVKGRTFIMLFPAFSFYTPHLTNWTHNFSGTGDYQWEVEFTYYCPEGMVIQAVVGPKLLEFKTEKIAEEFLECNRDLIKKALPLSI